MNRPGSAAAPTPDGRNRLSIELSGQVALLLDHVSGTLGVPKSQLVAQAIIDALPELVERADQVGKRADQLAAGSRKR